MKIVMERYCVNKNAQTSGEHEVHTENCKKLPEIYNRIDLGYFSTCDEALNKARGYYSNVDGCIHCCPKCHKK